MKENIYNKQESKLIDNKEFASNVAARKSEEFFGEQNFIIDAFICTVFVCIKDVAT